MSLGIIEALRITSERITSWARKNFATGLDIIDNKLYLKNSKGIIEGSEVTLTSGGPISAEVKNNVLIVK